MIHILVGESTQRDLALRRLKRKLLEGVGVDFNLEQFEGRSVTVQRLLEAVRQHPVLSPHRVVIVREADLIPKSELERLEKIGDLPTTTELIFVADKLDKRLRFWSKLSTAEWQEFRPLYPREVPRWVVEEAKGRGWRVSYDAALWLAERFGSALGLILSSLEKASWLRPNSAEISVADLETAVQGSAFSSVFELTDALGKGSLEKALLLYCQAIECGESPVGLLALIARHFRILAKVKETGEGAPPYFLKNYQEQAGRFTPEALYQATEELFRTDWDLKSSPLPADLIMEGLFLSLCT